MPVTCSASIRPRPVARLVAAAVFLLIAGFASPGLAANTFTWVGPNGGDWTTAANWSPSTAYPHGSNDIARVTSGATPMAVAIPAGLFLKLQQLQLVPGGGTITILGVNATLVLAPENNEPAIQTSGVGSIEIQAPVGLDRDSIVQVSADTAVTFKLPISDQAGPTALTKLGAGPMLFAAANTYSGTTTIEAGTLRLLEPNAIADTAKVDVRASGVFQLTKDEEIGELSITEGTVDVSQAQNLVASRLTMNGGRIRGALGHGILGLRGDAIVTSTNAQSALIESSMVIFFVGTRTFTVNDGPAVTDLDFEAQIGVLNTSNVSLIKDGPGTLLFGPTALNLNEGLFWVKEGLVELHGTINGNLRIGDGTGHAEVFHHRRDLIPDTRSVTVDADGVYRIANVETIEQLTVNGGTVRALEGALLMRALVMNGGLFDTGAPAAAAGGLLMPDLQNTRIEATSTATQTPTMTGLGRLALDGDLNIIVDKGPRPIDLIIDLSVVSDTARGLRKSGSGVARLTGNSTYAGATFVDGGTLLIDGRQASSVVHVGAATLGGVGLTGPVVATAGATIAPGASAGELQTDGNIQLAAGVTFAVEILSPTSSDRWADFGGTVTLANATLALTVAPGAVLPAGAQFIILANDGTDAIGGTFATLPEGASIVVDRYTFAISYHGGDGNDVALTLTSVAPDVPTYYLAEGATGGFFDEDVAIANPTDTDAPVTLTFLQEGGGTVVEHRTVPRQTRLTVHVDEIAGLENASPSVQIVSDQKVPLVAERTMFWDPSYYGGHTTNAVSNPERTWIFAEGFQGFFDTYLLIANANAVDTTATVTFLRENESPVVKTVPIAAFARKTIYAGEFSELIGRAFGMVVEATQPVIAERSMYFASIPGRLWTGGHVNPGVTAPSTSWFHAEGATGGFFNTFILLSNPQTSDAHIDLRFLLEDGTTIVKSKTLPAGQRLTVNPAAEGEPRLENAAVSTIVASDVPIVSERSMYWPGDATPFGEGHNSSGVVATATHWGLAEGRVGTPRHFTTYILLANPTTSAAQVTVTYLREAGAPVTKTYTVPPTSRFNIDVAGAVPELHDESFGARIDVTNSVAIAVERSLYWDANGIFWAGGTNALGTPLP